MVKINRRQLISHIGLGIGSLALTSCGGDIAQTDENTIKDVNNIAELRRLKNKFIDGQLINVLGHTNEGIGGGIFRVDLTDRSSADNNGSIVVGARGIRFKRIDVALPTAEMFGAGIDLQDDQSIFMNKCTDAYGKCYLQGGKTYNIQHPVTAIYLNTYGAGYATLKLISPSGDNRFGISPYADSAAVYCNGEIGEPLYGVNIENIIVHCNGLINSNKNVGVKGFLFMRCHGFYQRNCFVYDSSSYAFWDADADYLPLSVMTYCSGTREDCFAIDSHVSFEQVNCRGIILNNCHAYRSERRLSYTVEALFHSYGGSNMHVVYKNCSGIADGQCTAVLLFARECKKILISGCQFINNFNNGDNIQGGVFFEGQHASYDDIQFVDCIIISKYSYSAVLTIGEFGSNSSTFNFIGCNIEGIHVGVQINGNGGVFEFKNCNVKATASGDITPWAYYANGNPSTVKITGGAASSLGNTAVAASNMGYNIFENVILIPSPS